MHSLQVDGEKNHYELRELFLLFQKHNLDKA